MLGPRSHLPVVAALALSFVASILLVFQVQERIEQHGAPAGQTPSIGYEEPEAMVTLWRWADIASSWGGSYTAAPGATVQLSPRPSAASGRQDASASGSDAFRIDITLRADPLTAVMLAIVTCVSTLVAIYSIGYMHGDPGYWRFFTYVGLFVFSMTMLVSASNFLLLYVVLGSGRPVQLPA